MDKSSYWDRRQEQDRANFAALLAPLIIASRTRDFDGEKAKPQLHVWMISLQDVPRDVLQRAVEKLVGEGITWMPRPGDLRAACAADIAAIRRAASARAAAIMAACPRCLGSTFVEVELDGVARVTRCGCHAESLRALEGLPGALALPPANEDEVTA